MKFEGMRLLIRKLVLWGLLLFVVIHESPPIINAESIFETKLQNQPMTFTHLTTEHGLSQLDVNTIIQDKEGYLWFGTYDGLNKFDGYTFTVYKNDPSDPLSLSNNQIESLIEDDDGSIWVGTYRGGLNKFNKSTGQSMRYQYNLDNPDDPQGISQENINTMLMDTQGVLWIATNKGLNKMDKVTGKFTRYYFNAKGTNPAADQINELYEDSQGKLWVGTSAGLFQFDRNTTQYSSYFHNIKDESSLSNNEITSINEDKNHQLWVGTQSAGVNRFDRNTEQFKRYSYDPKKETSLNDNSVTQIYKDKQGVLWIGTMKNLDRWDELTDQFIHVIPNREDPYSINGISIGSIFQDNQLNFWVATSGGLNKYTRKSFLKFHAQTGKIDGLLNNGVYSIYEDRNEGIWLGTSDGLQVFDRVTGKFTQYQYDPLDARSISNGVVQAVYVDSLGTVWAGTTKGGLNRFNPDTQTFTRYNDIPSGKLNANLFTNIISISEMNEHQLLIATWAGLYLFDKNQEEFTLFPALKAQNYEKEFDLARFSHIKIDSKGDYWFGTVDRGVYRYNVVANKLTHLPIYPAYSNNLGSNSVSIVHEDKQGTIWIGSKGGLEKFDSITNKFIHYTDRDGLSSNLVWSILDDDEGNLWVSTSNGITKFNPLKQTFHRYDRSDGLQSNDFNIRSFLKTRDGDMFFGGNLGFNWFRPSLVTESEFKPPLVLNTFKVFEKIRLFNRPISQMKKIEISVKENFFSFEFAALDYRNPGRIQYAYKLEGFDKDWVYSKNRRYASYTNLNAGQYSFRVKATNSDGVWSNEEKTIEVYVVPAFWKRWWAYVIYGLLAVTFIYLIIRLRTQKQKQKLLLQKQELLHERKLNDQLRKFDQLKDEFLANTSHELRTPLHGIIGIAQSLVDGVAGKLSAQVIANLTLVVQSGERLKHLINDLLDSSKLKNKDIVLHTKPLDMKSITDIVMTLLHTISRKKGLLLVNSLTSDSLVIADENRVQQILYNLIGNAIKFTDRGQIEVFSNIVGNDLEITISDTGIGIAADQVGRIFEEFEQGDGSIQRQFEGTGLGLTITRKLVELHGGSIRVESTLGEGASFIFTLPLSSESITYPIIDRNLVELSTLSEGSHLDEAPQNMTMADPNLSNTILTIDDDLINLQVMENQLTLSGYTVRQASDGISALRLLKQGFKPDLILMDVMMPKMSGYELTRLIRELYTANELPIVLLTAKSQSSDIQVGFEMGANDYLVKPFSNVELNARIHFHLQLTKLHQTLELMVLERTMAIRNLLDNTGQGFLSFGADLKIQKEYSKECNRLFLTNLEGRFIHQLLFPDNLEQQKFIEQQLIDYFMEIDLNKKNNLLSELSNEMKLNNNTVKLEFKQIFNANDLEETKCMLILTDLSKIRDLESQVEQSEKFFAMEKLAVLGQLAAGIAHEIRNPLTVIDGFIQFLSKTGQDIDENKRKNYLEVMHHEVKRINELVSEFLLLAKPDTIKFQRSCIYVILKATIEFMNSEAKLHNIAMEYDFKDKELFIDIGQKQMKQVFMNVIKNAIEASKSGSRIRIDVLELEHNVQITIVDEGEGIPPEQLRKIFDPFFTLKDTGTGLGLSTSYSIVKSHSGEIDVVSLEGKGTTVTILLPLVK